MFGLKIYSVYIVVMSLLGFALMGIDKLLAKRGMRRISEKTLLMVGALGGAAGSWLAMGLFRHKTKHRVFSLGLPLYTILHLAIFAGIIFLEYKGGFE